MAWHGMAFWWRKGALGVGCNFEVCLFRVRSTELLLPVWYIRRPKYYTRYAKPIHPSIHPFPWYHDVPPFPRPLAFLPLVQKPPLLPQLIVLTPTPYPQTQASTPQADSPTATTQAQTPSPPAPPPTTPHPLPHSHPQHTNHAHPAYSPQHPPAVSPSPCTASSTAQ